MWRGRVKVNSLYIFAEQAIFSSSSFLLTVGLAKLLPKEEFGIFTVILSFMLGAAGIYESAVMRPYSVYANKNIDQKKYATFVLGLSTLIFCVIFISILPIIFIYINYDYVFLSMLAFYLMMMYWVMRRNCYIYMKYKNAFVAGVVANLIVIIGLLIIYNSANRSLSHVFFLMVVSNGIAFVYLYFVNIGRMVFLSKKIIKILFIKHVRFGKWMAATTIVFTLSTIVYIPLIAWIRGPVEAGFFRLLQTLTMPANQINAALSLAFLPRLTKMTLNEKIFLYKKIFRIFIILPFLYVVIFSFISDIVFNFLGYKEESTSYQFIVLVFGFAVVSEAGYQAISLFINSMKLAKPLFVARFISVVFMIIIGIPLIIFANYGYVMAYSISSCVCFLTIYLEKKRLLNDKSYNY